MATEKDIHIFYRIKGYLLEDRPKDALATLRVFPLQSSFYDENGTTLLHYAVSQGQAEVAIYLIKNGSDVNFANREGNTALILAMQRLPFTDDLKCIDCLTFHGADLAHKNNAGFNALGIFAMKKYFGNKEILNTILNVIKSSNISDMDIAVLFYDAGWPVWPLFETQRSNIISLMINMAIEYRSRMSTFGIIAPQVAH